MRNRSIIAMAATSVIAAVTSIQAAPIIDVTFQEGTHGEVITNKFLAQYGFTVAANNLVSGHPDKAIIFNSRERNTADPDLEGFNSFADSSKEWTRGNLKGKNDLGKLLILAENDVDANNNNLIDSPDDEGARPAGTISFSFRTAITELAFNLVDIEGPTEFGNDSGFVMVFSGPEPASEGGGPGVAQVGFSQFITPNNQFFDSTVKFGDNSANAIKTITAAQVGLENFNQVTFNFGGSGAVDRLQYSFIPEPASAAFLLGAVALVRRRRV